MDDLEKFERWIEDIKDWEHFQDELERINGKSTCDNLCDKAQKEW